MTSINVMPNNMPQINRQDL